MASSYTAQQLDVLDSRYRLVAPTDTPSSPPPPPTATTAYQVAPLEEPAAQPATTYQVATSNRPSTIIEVSTPTPAPRSSTVIVDTPELEVVETNPGSSNIRVTPSLSYQAANGISAPTVTGASPSTVAVTQPPAYQVANGISIPTPTVTGATPLLSYQAANGISIPTPTVPTAAITPVSYQAATRTTIPAVTVPSAPVIPTPTPISYQAATRTTLPAVTPRPAPPPENIFTAYDRRVQIQPAPADILVGGETIIKTSTSTDGGLLGEIQKKILGQRNEQISALELYNAFKLPITPEFNLILYRALKSNALNPDLTILQAIPHAVKGDYLIPLALCLRSSADPNMYLTDPKLGTVHILGYIYNTLSNSNVDVLNTIVLLFIAKGSDPNLPMFDHQGGKVRSSEEVIPNSPTVLQWLNTNGYSTILNQLTPLNSSSLPKVIDADSLTILAILLDSPRLMRIPNLTDDLGRDYQASDMSLAIKAFASLSLELIPTETTSDGLDFVSLNDSVTYLNSAAFLTLVDRGQRPSYVLMTKILSRMRTYQERNNVIPFQELQRMLSKSLEIGIVLDQQQYSLISFLGQDVLEAVNKEYQVPYWKKTCQNLSNATNAASPELQRLALSLNIDPSKSQGAICDDLATLSRADKEALREAARLRQQLRMAEELGTVDEFLNNRVPTLTCVNRSLLAGDPLEYNDIDIAYYRDEQGQVWCFTSNLFASLLETGINPYNSTVLPRTFLEKLQCRIESLRRLGIASHRSQLPTSYERALNRLAAPDQVPDPVLDPVLTELLVWGSQRGVSATTIESLSKAQLSAGLNALGYPLDLSTLSNRHALITTAHVVTIIGKQRPADLDRFFNALK